MADPQIMVDAPIERTARLWMRAYPRRWREVRGEELLGLVVDLAGPDARHLGATAAFDLVRGGWATRWREHPPVHTWLLYRMFGRRIPAAYRSWALDDIDGLWYPIRSNLPVIVVLFAMQLVSPMSSRPQSAWYYLVWVFVPLSWLFLWPEGNRSSARLKHVAPPFGEPLVAGNLAAGYVLRQRVTARSMLSWAVLLLGITGTASVVAALFAPKVLLTNVVKPASGTGYLRESGPVVSAESFVAPVGGYRVVAVAILVVALSVGVLGAVVARRRLRRLLGERPEQPNRVLRQVRATSKANLLFGVMISTGVAWLEVSGRLVLGLSLVVGTVALVLLPGAVVALAAMRRSDAPDLAGTDVWWIGARGRLPSVDLPVWGLMRLPGPVPPDGRNGARHG
jgi:uncharacterized membrane protein